MRVKSTVQPGARPGSWVTPYEFFDYFKEMVNLGVRPINSPWQE